MFFRLFVNISKLCVSSRFVIENTFTTYKYMKVDRPCVRKYSFNVQVQDDRTHYEFGRNNNRPFMRLFSFIYFSSLDSRSVGVAIHSDDFPLLYLNKCDVRDILLNMAVISYSTKSIIFYLYAKGVVVHVVNHLVGVVGYRGSDARTTAAPQLVEPPPKLRYSDRVKETYLYVRIKFRHFS